MAVIHPPFAQSEYFQVDRFGDVYRRYSGGGRTVLREAPPEGWSLESQGLRFRVFHSGFQPGENGPELQVHLKDGPNWPVDLQRNLSPGIFRADAKGIHRLPDWKTEPEPVKKVLLCLGLHVGHVLDLKRGGDGVSSVCPPDCEAHVANYDWAIHASPWRERRAPQIHRIQARASMSGNALRAFANTLSELVLGYGADWDYAQCWDESLAAVKEWASSRVFVDLRERTNSCVVHWTTQKPTPPEECHLDNVLFRDKTRAIGRLMDRWGERVLTNWARDEKPTWRHARQEPSAAWWWLLHRTYVKVTARHTAQGIICMIAPKRGNQKTYEPRPYLPNWRSVYGLETSVNALSGDRYAEAFTLLDLPGAVDFALRQTRHVEHEPERSDHGSTE